MSADFVGLGSEAGSQLVVGVLLVKLPLQGRVPQRHQLKHLRTHRRSATLSDVNSDSGVPVNVGAYLLPLLVDVLTGDGGVGVGSRQLDVVALCNL